MVHVSLIESVFNSQCSKCVYFWGYLDSFLLKVHMFDDIVIGNALLVTGMVWRRVCHAGLQENCRGNGEKEGCVCVVNGDETGTKGKVSHHLELCIYVYFIYIPTNLHRLHRSIESNNLIAISVFHCCDVSRCVAMATSIQYRNDEVTSLHIKITRDVSTC